MRDRILSSVLLPAPLRPMTPTTSPRLISNETSFGAQIVSEPLERWNVRTFKYGGDHIAQGVMTRLRLVDAIALTEVFNANGYFIHR